MTRHGLTGGALAALVPAAHAADYPMSYLHTAGPAADAVTALGWGLGAVSVAVTAIVAVLLVGGLLRRRARPATPRQLAVARDGGGASWIYIGVGVSTLVLVGCAVWTVFALNAVAMPARSALTLQVAASQWWWSVRYLDPADPSRTFVTANEIHVPVGEPVRVELASDDVIHSFWVPQLAGKTDVIPGQTNVKWLQADRPGVYRGQCGEYCGAQHAQMALAVQADSRADFDAWRAAQLRDARPPASPTARAGEAVFMARCAACHAVRGTPAGGIVGPDLTHLMSRATIAAGMLPNTPGNLTAWVADAQALKPGARMPTLTLSGTDLAAVVDYLGTLE